MSDGSTEGPTEDPELQVTAIQRRPVKRSLDLAAVDEETQRSQEAERVRKAAIAAEAAQANSREIADLVKRNHAYIEHAVDMAKTNAKIRADRERMDALMDAKGSSKRNDPLVMESKAVAKVTVGLVIAFILLIIGLVVAGIYFLVTQNGPTSNVPTRGTPGEIVSAVADTIPEYRNLSGESDQLSRFSALLT